MLKGDYVLPSEWRLWARLSRIHLHPSLAESFGQAIILACVVCTMEEVGVNNNNRDKLG